MAALPTLLLSPIGITVLPLLALPKNAKLFGIVGLRLITLDSLGSVVFSIYLTTLVAAEGAYPSDAFRTLQAN